MSEYISKEWLKEHIEVISYEGMWHETETDEFVSVENIDSVPSIDIVRCNECIHFDGFYCNKFGEPAEYNSPYSDDGNDFCSFGERKESE